MRRLVVRFNSGISRDYIGGNEDIHWLYSHLCPTGIDGVIEVFDFSATAIARHFDKPLRCLACDAIYGSYHKANCSRRHYRVNEGDCRAAPKTPVPVATMVHGRCVGCGEPLNARHKSMCHRYDNMHHIYVLRTDCPDA
jgi:hypothetical protein